MCLRRVFRLALLETTPNEIIVQKSQDLLLPSTDNNFYLNSASVYTVKSTLTVSLV